MRKLLATPFVVLLMLIGAVGALCIFVIEVLWPEIIETPE